MRKSSISGRPSLSSVPLRVRQENGSQKASRSSSSIKGKEKARSLSGVPSTSAFGFAGSSRQSFLPKPSGRPSSGIGVRGRTDVPKDPRPIKDSTYMNQSKKQLLQFLTEHQYPNPISTKILTSPTSKAYFEIFAFIYSLLRPDYKMVAKMEEEVPKVLRMLAYPFSFSKQYLYSVGSPHTWPYLLAALVWMIELIQMTKAMEDQSNLDAFIFGGSDFDRKSDDQIFYEYSEKTYRAFLEGEDSFAGFDEDLRSTLRQAYQGENIENLDEENMRLENDLMQAHQEEADIKEMEKDISNLVHDERSLKDYYEDLDRCKRKTQADLAECEEACKLCESDLATEQAKLQELKLLYENQDLTPADVQRLKLEQTRLRTQVEQVEKQVEDIESENWKIQMEASRVDDEVEKLVAVYNRQAINLKLVPETAELSDGKDFRLKAGYCSDIESKFENTIKDKLKVLKVHHNESVWRKNKEKFQLQVSLEKQEEQLNEEKDRLAKNLKELENIEAELGSFKQTLQSDKRTLDSQLEDVDQDIHHILTERAALEKSLAAAEQKKNKAKFDLEEKMTVSQRDLEEIAEVKKEIQTSFEAYKLKSEAEMKRVLDMLKSKLAEKEEKVERLKQEKTARDLRLQKLKSEFENLN